MKEHRTRVALAVALQLLILVGIVGARQWTLSTGMVILLETAPVDPRDLFRGDYVILRYKISTLNPGALGSTETFRQGQPVYVGVDQRGEFWTAVSVGSSRPPTLFLKGTVLRHRNLGPMSSSMSVEYGIESYFIPEGTGPRIERARERLSVEVAVGTDGTAVIRRLFIGGVPLK